MKIYLVVVCPRCLQKLQILSRYANDCSRPKGEARHCIPKKHNFI